MAKNAPITGTVNAPTFDAAQWLCQFESVGGGYLATDSQTCLCTAHQVGTRQQQVVACAMAADLTDDQRAAVIGHIRNRAGLIKPQPDLKAIPLENLSEPTGNAQPSSGDALDNQSEGQADMDMMHSFTQASPAEAPVAVAGENFGISAQAWITAREALENHQGDEGIPDSLVDARSDAWQAMLDIPAPDLAALGFKLKHLLHVTPAFNATSDWSGEEVRQTLADIDLLLGSPSVQNEASPVSASISYFIELDALDALAAQVNTGNFPESEGDRWEEWAIRLWHDIERLPAIQGNARIKARAVWSIMGGEMEALGSDTCSRLIGQIVSGLRCAVPPARLNDATPNHRAEWQSAMARYLQADRAMDDNPGDPTTDKFLEAEAEILGTRTPDLQALRWKTERLRDISNGSTINTSDMDDLLADIAHLLGGA